MDESKGEGEKSGDGLAGFIAYSVHLGSLQFDEVHNIKRINEKYGEKGVNLSDYDIIRVALQLLRGITNSEYIVCRKADGTATLIDVYDLEMLGISLKKKVEGGEI